MCFMGWTYTKKHKKTQAGIPSLCGTMIYSSALAQFIVLLNTIEETKETR